MDKEGFGNLKRILKGKDPKKKLQVGFEGKNKSPTTYDKEVGQEWEEHGKKWIMKESGAETIDRMQEYRMPWFCPECKSVMNGSKDRKVFYIHGTCLNCLVDYHEKLRKAGKLDQFAFRKRLLSSISWFEEREKEFDEFIEKAGENPEFVYSDGRTEKWDNQIDMEPIIEEYKEFLKDYKEKLNNSIKKYENKYGESLNEWQEPE